MVPLQICLAHCFPLLTLWSALQNINWENRFSAYSAASVVVSLLLLSLLLLLIVCCLVLNVPSYCSFFFARTHIHTHTHSYTHERTQKTYVTIYNGNDTNDSRICVQCIIAYNVWKLFHSRKSISIAKEWRRKRWNCKNETKC